MNLQHANTTTDPIRVLIVDDHPTVREGLGHCISAQPDMTVCGEAVDVSQAIEQIIATEPDLAIVDIALKNSNGLDLIKAVTERYPHVATLVHSMYEEELYAVRCLRAGARGYVNKEARLPEVMSAIRNVISGQLHLSGDATHDMQVHTVCETSSVADPLANLTDRQIEVFRLIGAGYSASQIAQRLHISVHTVETHRENIKQRLQVSSAQLDRLAALRETQNQRDSPSG